MLERLRNELRFILRGYGTIRVISPWFLTFSLIKGLLEALSPFVNIYMSGRIINALTARRDLRDLLVLVLLTVGANLAITLFVSIVNRPVGVLTNLFRGKTTYLINQKLDQLDYQSVEDPGIQRMRQRLHDFQNWSSLGLSKLFHRFGPLTKHFFVVVFSVAVVLGAFTAAPARHARNWTFVSSPLFSGLVVLFICLNVVFSMVLNARATKATYEVGKGFISSNRVFGYYAELIGNYRMGKDIRLYNQKDLIMREGWEGMFTHGMRIFHKMIAFETRYANLNVLLSTLVSGLVYAFVALRALSGLYSIGSIVQYVGSIQQLIGGFSGFMTIIAEFRANDEALQLFYQFLDLQSPMRKGTLPIEKRDDNEYAIEFHNVSFRYPGSQVCALRNLNLKLNIGQKLAVVGMNGSGKTTMIKLLCRLYDPTEGEITLNGIDIRKYDYAEYMAIFSVVFQDFKLFSLPLGQNVAADTAYDQQRVEACLDAAGFGDRYAQMPDGTETNLYKDFAENGVEISGGEAQKIALARALHKDAPFVVLDEPTAALDPIAEFEIYAKFDTLVGGKTAIYISHRLSSCRFCDDIAVFHKGELVQRGSHDQLVTDKDGKYYALWHAQAQYYVTN